MLFKSNKKQPLATAICREVPSTVADQAWLPLIPAGEFSGRDKRAWNNSNPEGIVDAFIARNADLPVDFEHATEIKAPKGEPAPATGWIVALEVRDGEIWGKVKWTDLGLNAIRKREVRYYSPAFRHDKNGTVIALSSVGLTNKHNLDLPALNKETPTPTPEDDAMPLDKKIREALGLSDKADVDDAVTAINTQKTELSTALNQAKTPDLNLFVPKADLQLALNRAQQAEQKLADIETAQLNAEIDAEINSALEAGKIAPANKDYFTGLCRQEGGLDKFKDYVKTAPAVVSKSELDKKDPDKTDTALNAELSEMAASMGLSEQDIKEFGGIQ